MVYSGLETRYHDFTLAPGVEYCYSVTATNSQGSVLSPLVKDQTSPSAPSGLQPPKLQASDALEVLADWDSPVRTNSEIISYTSSPVSCLKENPECCELIQHTVLLISGHSQSKT